ncbi:hypothetical protein SLA2020_439750 [Shorea laevis]
MARAQTEGIAFTKQPYVEDVGPRKIKSLQFSTFSESEISKLAEVQVYKAYITIPTEILLKAAYWIPAWALQIRLAYVQHATVVLRAVLGTLGT